MQRFVYLIILAVVLLFFKAFFIDEYLENRGQENNTSLKAVPEETTQSSGHEMNITGMSVEKQSVSDMPEEKKMPLDRLGDSLSKNIKL